MRLRRQIMYRVTTFLLVTIISRLTQQGPGVPLAAVHPLPANWRTTPSANDYLRHKHRDLRRRQSPRCTVGHLCRSRNGWAAGLSLVWQLTNVLPLLGS